MKFIQRFGDYAKLTFVHHFDQEMLPGQCAKINGNWYAIAEQRSDEFDILVKTDSSLLSSDDNVIEGPLGPGFKNADCKNAVLVAGGTGIGALIHLLKVRAEQGLDSYLIHFARSSYGMKELIPSGTCKKYVFWNTTWHHGRPDSPILPLCELPPESQVFVSGPKSLVTACKSLQLPCNTNF